MITRFEKVPLTKAEKETGFLTFFRIARLIPRKWFLLLFFIPVLLLFISLTRYIDLINFLTELSKVAGYIVLIAIINFLLDFIEIKLGFKKVGHVQVLIKVNLFFFKFIILRDFFPLILEPQNTQFDRLKKGDMVILEKTGLNRLIVWRTI